MANMIPPEIRERLIRNLTQKVSASSACRLRNDVSDTRCLLHQLVDSPVFNSIVRSTHSTIDNFLAGIEEGKAQSSSSGSQERETSSTSSSSSSSSSSQAGSSRSSAGQHASSESASSKLASCECLPKCQLMYACIQVMLPHRLPDRTEKPTPVQQDGISNVLVLHLSRASLQS